jgi:hypothetical protein
MFLRRIFKSGSIAIATTLAFCTWQPGHAQTVHALLIGNTNADLGDGAAENLRKMSNLLKSIKTVAELKVATMEIRDDSFTCANILSGIEKLRAKVKSDDAVIFYYAGHGYRTKTGESKFPDLACPGSRKKPPIELEGVAKRLTDSKTKPRFVLAIADACNSEAEPVEESAAQAPPGGQQDRRAGLRRLFLGYKGQLVMSAAKRGQLAWYMNEGDLLGGFFTNQFISVLNRRVAMDAQAVRWEDIADQATQEINASNDPQRPLLQKPDSSVALTALPAR